MTVDMKIDANALKALIASEIQKQDGLANKCATQMMVEGTNIAQDLCLKDSGDLHDSIPEASKVTRIGPCIYDVTLANGMDYGAAQEMGPQSGKRVWRFRPHIRPAAMIMQVKSSEIIDRVYNG
jgi:hypothetical protein